MTNEELWKSALGELELLISKANFTTWFKNTFVSAYEVGRVIVCVPNTFTKVWLEKKYHSAILHALKNSTGNAVCGVEYKVSSARNAETASSTDTLALNEAQKELSAEGAQKAPTISVTGNPIPRSVNKYGLNERYQFKSFIVGKGNELAHAAAKAVAERPGTVYNPLFIYGGVGLGKTHLLQAVGHHILEQNPTIKILYVNAEKFTNDYIQAVKNGHAKQFNDTYRLVDLLLIDDIQFIAGKERTQEALFHTFNALHQNNCQVVLSSDRPPNAIPSLEKRLQSRFEWGMIADVSQPDFETRVAILEAKCKERLYDLSPEMLSCIANSVHNNVRELEGALNRVIAHHQFHQTSPTTQSIKEVLNNSTFARRRALLSSQELMEHIADFFHITVDDLIGKSRKKELVLPRQIAMYLMREELSSSYPNIGQELGNRDHTTAMHAYTKIHNAIESDTNLRQSVDLIRQRIYNEI